MVNAFCVILSQICKKYIVACPELDSYVSNREAVFVELSKQFELNEIPTDRDTLKRCFLIPLHHGCYKRQITSGVEIPILERFQSEMKDVAVKLKSLPTYKGLAETIKKRKDKTNK